MLQGRIIIAGSRDVPITYMQITTALRQVRYEPLEVVQGACPTGADAAARLWAKLNKVPCRGFPADWDTHGLAAGPRRNREMARYGQALLAFWDGASRGTADMIQAAGQLGLRLHVVRVAGGANEQARRWAAKGWPGRYRGL